MTIQVIEATAEVADVFAVRWRLDACGSYVQSKHTEQRLLRVHHTTNCKGAAATAATEHMQCVTLEIVVVVGPPLIPEPQAALAVIARH